MVYGVDIDSQKFEDVKHCGATACIVSLGVYSNVKSNATINFAGVGSTTAEAVVAVKAGGCIVLVGLGASEVRVSTIALALRGITLRGSVGAGLDDLSTVFVLTAAGSITLVFTETSLRKFMKDWFVLIKVSLWSPFYQAAERMTNLGYVVGYSGKMSAGFQFATMA